MTERTTRDWLFLGCEDGHQWEFIGGRNCGCKDGSCSVPVHRCKLCADCDYGENAEAADVRDLCLMERE